MRDDPDRLIRWTLRGSLVLAIVGVLLFILAVAIPSASGFFYALGLVVLIAGLIMWAAILADRFIRSIFGLPRRKHSVSAPARYTCPNCGYLLRGVRGPYCPECGTVRPAPVDGDDSSA